MSLKEDLETLAKKYKFWFLIKSMDDQEIIEFITDEVFHMTNEELKQDCTYEDARIRALKVFPNIDQLASKQDQETMFNLGKKYAQ